MSECRPLDYNLFQRDTEPVGICGEHPARAGNKQQLPASASNRARTDSSSFFLRVDKMLE